MDINKHAIEFIKQDEVISEIFFEHIFKKYYYDGFFNVEPLFSLKLRESSLDLDEELSNISRFASRRDQVNTLTRVLSCVYYNAYAKKKLKHEIIPAFVQSYIDDCSLSLNSPKSIIDDNYYIMRSDIKIERIYDLCEYLELLTQIEVEEGHELYFRGHSNANYILLPSIFREERIYNNEQYFYNSITRLCPKDFEKCKSHIDQLVEMQHYELPTRLLDISKNSLVALLFACLGDEDKDAEVIVFSEQKSRIKYGQSDTLTILACLSSFSPTDKSKLLKALDDHESIEEFNHKPIVQRLLHEIKTEKPAFKDEIKPLDLKKSLLALPTLHNNRIIRQSGAFFIAGLVEYSEVMSLSEILNRKRIKKGEVTPIYIIVGGGPKKNIKKQLQICDLNEATIFPEIDAVARYLKKQF